MDGTQVARVRKIEYSGQKSVEDEELDGDQEYHAREGKLQQKSWRLDGDLMLPCYRRKATEILASSVWEMRD